MSKPSDWNGTTGMTRMTSCYDKHCSCLLAPTSPSLPLAPPMIAPTIRGRASGQLPSTPPTNWPPLLSIGLNCWPSQGNPPMHKFMH